MGGNPRFCVQCGSGLSPGTRFCGECGHATVPAEVGAAVVAQPGPVSREIDLPSRGPAVRPGPPPPRSSSPRPSAWPEAAAPVSAVDTSVDSDPIPADDGYAGVSYQSSAQNAGYPAGLGRPDLGHQGPGPPGHA